MTAVERDAEGRPSKWTIETESEFDEEEREAWDAWLEWQASI